MRINNTLHFIPEWYSASTCWHKVVFYLALAQWSIQLARIARGTIYMDRIQKYLEQAEQERTTAAIYYAAYLARRIAGTPVIAAAPAVDYTVWDY